MDTAKIFSNGGSQAVRLPKEFRFHEDEVLVNKIGNILILAPKSQPWQGMFDSLDYFTDDFLAEPIGDLQLQEPDL